MSDRPPNQLARVAAVGGVIVMFLLVIVVIASAGGGDDSGSSDKGSSVSTSTGRDASDPRIERALQNGIYVVQEGDTLTSISEATGVDVDVLITLNPTTDPQILVAGTHLKLK